MKFEAPKIIYDEPKRSDFKYGFMFNVCYRIWIRTKLAEQQNHICCYCHDTMTEYRYKENSATIDHIIPLGKGGADTIDNMIICCDKCNHKKRDSLLVNNMIVDVPYVMGKKKKRANKRRNKNKIFEMVRNNERNSFLEGTKSFELYVRYQKSEFLSQIQQNNTNIEISSQIDSKEAVG